MGASPKPFQQGGLDCLCGVYSFVNAIQALRGCDDYEALFREIVEILAKKKLLLPALTDGLNTHQMSRLLTAIVPRGVAKSLPWRGRGKRTPSLGVFWKSMQEFLDDSDGTGSSRKVILLAMEGKHDHWTVVVGITRDSVLLRDSNSLKRLLRKRITTSRLTGRRIHLLAPGSAFFLERQTDDYGA